MEVNRVLVREHELDSRTTYVSFNHKDWVYLGEDVTDSKGYYEATMNEDYNDIVKNTGGEFYIDTPYVGDAVTL